MNRYPISGCTFIRDAIKGAFYLFESMAMMLPLVDDMHVMDMGSTDGTLELLHIIARANERIHIHAKDYTSKWNTPHVLSYASNDVVAFARHDNVLFWQADEIWHEHLVQTMVDIFEQGVFNMTFWRYQLRDNFQRVHWLPHIVYRAGPRSMFHWSGNSMNPDKIIGAKTCGGHGGGWPQWSGKDPASIPAADIPTRDMILDVCSFGAPRDNIVYRRGLHHPLWGQSRFIIEGQTPNEWQREANANPVWTRQDTPYDIPNIVRWHVGRTSYVIRPELIEILKNDGEWICK